MLYSLLLMRSKFLQKDKLKKKEKPQATGDLIGNKTAGRITKFSKYLQQNNSETYTNQYDKEISKERYISPEERQENLDDSRLIK